MRIFIARQKHSFAAQGLRAAMAEQGADDGEPNCWQPSVAPPSLVRKVLALNSGGSQPACAPSQQQAPAPEAMVWSQGPCSGRGPDPAVAIVTTDTATAQPAFESGTVSFSQPPLRAGQAATVEQAQPVTLSAGPRLSGGAALPRRSGQSTGRVSLGADAAAAPVAEASGVVDAAARAADEEEDERIPITGGP